MMRPTDGSAFSLLCNATSEAESAAVSEPLVLAAMSGTGSRLDVPNGLASTVAFSTGALAGRNLVLSLCVTPDRPGSKAEAATAPLIQTRSIAPRERNLHRQRGPNKAAQFHSPTPVDQTPR